MIEGNSDQTPAWFRRIRHVPEKQRLGVQEPPMHWFHGIGYKGEGIDSVAFTDKLGQLGDGVLVQHLANFGKLAHFAYRTVDASGKPVDPSEGARYRQEIAQSERVILDTTGFTAQEIFDLRHKLTEEYRGKQEAPFKVSLF